MVKGKWDRLDDYPLRFPWPSRHTRHPQEKEKGRIEDDGDEESFPPIQLSPPFTVMKRRLKKKRKEDGRDEEGRKRSGRWVLDSSTVWTDAAAGSPVTTV